MARVWVKAKRWCPRCERSVMTLGLSSSCPRCGHITYTKRDPLATFVAGLDAALDRALALEDAKPKR